MMWKKRKPRISCLEYHLKLVLKAVLLTLLPQMPSRPYCLLPLRWVWTELPEVVPWFPPALPRASRWSPPDLSWSLSASLKPPFPVVIENNTEICVYVIYSKGEIHVLKKWLCLSSVIKTFTGMKMKHILNVKKKQFQKKNFSTYYATIFTVFIFFYWVCILLIICESQDKFPSLCDVQYRCFKILNSQSILINTSNTEHYTCFSSQSDINILLVNRPIKLPFWSPFVDVRFPSLFSPFLWF